MNIKCHLRSQVLTASGGKYAQEAIRDVSLMVFPEVRALHLYESIHGKTRKTGKDIIIIITRTDMVSMVGEADSESIKVARAGRTLRRTRMVQMKRQSQLKSRKMVPNPITPQRVKSLRNLKVMENVRKKVLPSWKPH